MRENINSETSDSSQLSPSPRVSVLMVTYNHGEWVGAAIESILSQDDCGGFELIIGEDCSTDRTREVVLEYQRRFPQTIRVLTSEENVGPAANHARVIAAARGEFLAFCEGDDYWCHPRKLAEQADLLARDAGAAMVHANWVRSRRSRDGSWRADFRAPEHSGIPNRLLEGDLFHVFYFGKILRTCTLMLRASALQAYKADPISTRRYRFEDTVINAFFTSRWRVAYWPEVAAVYRESPGSLLRSGLESKIRFLQSSLQFDSDARLYFADRKDYPQAYRWDVATGLLLWAIRGRDWAAARQALSDIRSNFGMFGFVRSGWQSIRRRLPGAWIRFRRRVAGVRQWR